MPNRRGYPQRGGYGGGYQSNYQYQQPAAAQYESFFNPIPIDFLQQNLQQHQGRYDQAFAGALAAKEAALQESIALGDTAYRSQLIDSSMKDMDKIAQEKYGGDYGRAAKDISREVTNLRADPFWNSSKHLKEQQALQQKFMLENPDAHLYQDVRNIGAYDPETQQIRGEEQLTFQAGKKGDWQGSVEKQFADIKGTQLFNALQKSNVPGYFENVTIKDLKAEDLRTLLDDNPQMVEASITNNPDFERSGLEIRGEDKAGVREEAKDFILGNILDKPFREERGSVTADQGYWLRYKAAADNQLQNPWGDMQGGEKHYTGIEADPSGQRKKITLGFFDENGSVMDGDQYKASLTPDDPTAVSYGIGRSSGATTAQSAYGRGQAKRKSERRMEDRENVVKLVDDLRTNQPDDFAGMTDLEVYDEFLNNSENYKFAVNFSKPLFNPDYSQNIGIATNNNIAGTDFYMQGDDREGATKYVGKGGIADRTGIPLQVFEDMMLNPDYGKGYDLTEAMYFIEVPKFKNKNGPTLNSNGSINWTKSPTAEDTERVYFHPDQYTSRTNQVISGLNEGLKGDDLELVETTLANFTQGATLDKEIYNQVRGSTSKDINKVKMISLPTNDGSTALFSLDDMRARYFSEQTKRLGNIYFKRD